MPSPQEKKPFPLSADLIAAEYSALREEILKLTEIQFQILVITLAAFGTMLATGIQYKNAPIVLAYPILALFLAMGWINHAHGIDMLGAYIQNKIESQVGTANIGWENFSRAKPVKHSLLADWLSRMPFIVTQLIALMAGITIISANVLNIILVIIAVASTGANIFVFATTPRAQIQRRSQSSAD